LQQAGVAFGFYREMLTRIETKLAHGLPWKKCEPGVRGGKRDHIPKKVSISEQVFVNHVPAFLKDLKGVEGLFDYAEYRPNRVTFNCWNKLNGARRKRQELEQEKVHSSAFPQLPVAAPL
jgi:hypothetical protein